jgi:hypothetical protein
MGPIQSGQAPFSTDGRGAAGSGRREEVSVECCEMRRPPTLMLVCCCALGMQAGGCCALGIFACDGAFMADGAVVDTQDKPIAGVTVKARNRTDVTDEDGCFHLFEITGVRKHMMPISATASSYRAFIGELPSPGSQRVRIVLADTTGTGPSYQQNTLPAGDLGRCEPKAKPARSR